MTTATATRTCQFGMCDRPAVNHVEVTYPANPATGRAAFTWEADECQRCTDTETTEAEVLHADVTVNPL